MSNINLIKIKESLREEIEWRKKTDNLADVMSDMSSDEKREIFLLWKNWEQKKQRSKRSDTTKNHVARNGNAKLHKKKVQMIW